MIAAKVNETFKRGQFDSGMSQETKFRWISQVCLRNDATHRNHLLHSWHSAGWRIIPINPKTHMSLIQFVFNNKQSWWGHSESLIHSEFRLGYCRPIRLNAKVHNNFAWIFPKIFIVQQLVTVAFATVHLDSDYRTGIATHLHWNAPGTGKAVNGCVLPDMLSMETSACIVCFELFCSQSVVCEFVLFGLLFIVGVYQFEYWFQ